MPKVVRRKAVSRVPVENSQTRCCQSRKTPTPIAAITISVDTAFFTTAIPLGQQSPSRNFTNSIHSSLKMMQRIASEALRKASIKHRVAVAEADP
jgi:hypothetical protein